MTPPRLQKASAVRLRAAMHRTPVSTVGQLAGLAGPRAIVARGPITPSVASRETARRLSSPSPAPTPGDRRSKALDLFQLHRPASCSLSRSTARPASSRPPALGLERGHLDRQPDQGAGAALGRPRQPPTAPSGAAATGSGSRSRRPHGAGAPSRPPDGLVTSGLQHLRDFELRRTPAEGYPPFRGARGFGGRGGGCGWHWFAEVTREAGAS
jgi:hypothetical protein